MRHWRVACDESSTIFGFRTTTCTYFEKSYVTAESLALESRKQRASYQGY
jgi:hypothetical protein